MTFKIATSLTSLNLISHCRHSEQRAPVCAQSQRDRWLQGLFAPRVENTTNCTLTHFCVPEAAKRVLLFPSSCLLKLFSAGPPDAREPLTGQTPPSRILLWIIAHPCFTINIDPVLVIFVFCFNHTYLTPWCFSPYGLSSPSSPWWDEVIWSKCRLVA